MTSGGPPRDECWTRTARSDPGPKQSSTCSGCPRGPGMGPIPVRLRHFGSRMWRWSAAWTKHRPDSGIACTSRHGTCRADPRVIVRSHRDWALRLPRRWGCFGFKADEWPPAAVHDPGLRLTRCGVTGTMGVASSLREGAMAWRLDGTYFENCSCQVACPCTVGDFAVPPPTTAVGFCSHSTSTPGRSRASM